MVQSERAAGITCSTRPGNRCCYEDELGGIDGIVIEGEITLVLDDGEAPLKTGAVVIQRGTNHAWANRSGRMCRMLFVLVSGAYEPALAASLDGR